jgi:hypothetical protein
VSYFYTRVPASWSPLHTYQLSSEIILKPAGMLAYNDYMGKGSMVRFDTVFFISASLTVEKHLALLREWILFHSFVFDFSHLCHFFEDGWLIDHIQVKSIEEVLGSPEKTDYQIVYKNVAKQVYWLHEPSTVIPYNSLFEKYKSLSSDEVYLLKSFLVSLSKGSFRLGGYDLFGNISKFWKGAVYLGIVENIIGHPPQCENSSIKCEICKKSLPHRQGSETEWRKRYLSEIIKDDGVAKEYFDVLEFGFYHVRHPAAHVQLLPSPDRPVHEKGIVEVYDIERGVGNYKVDQTALNSMFINIHQVTRYLLLHSLFGLNEFPKLIPLKSISI